MKAYRFLVTLVALSSLCACSLLDTQDRVPQDVAEQAFCDWQNAGGKISHTYDLKVFNDYEEPACQQAGQIIQSYKQLHPQNFNLSIVQYPLDTTCNPALLRQVHGNACTAAQYVLCAEAQDLAAYWTVHNTFLHLNSLTPSVLNIVLSKLGLNEAAILHCVHTGQTKARLAVDIKQGMNLGIDGIPSIMVNGIKIPALMPAMLDRFMELLIDGTKIDCSKPAL